MLALVFLAAFIIGISICIMYVYRKKYVRHLSNYYSMDALIIIIMLSHRKQKGHQVNNQLKVVIKLF